MALFQDSLDKTKNSEIITSNAYQDIKPTGTMTNEEAITFLDDLFSIDTENQDVYSIDEESFFPEIFGRSEDEFSFDFEFDDEIQAILERFKPSVWAKMSDCEKIDAISELAKDIGKKLELSEQPEIQICETQDGSYGAYLLEENKLMINSKRMDDSNEVMDTIAHEMRHAYQYQRAQQLQTRLDLLYKLNFENYISPILLEDGKYLFLTDYQDQLIESEARAFAKEFTHKEVAE